MSFDEERSERRGQIEEYALSAERRGCANDEERVTKAVKEDSENEAREREREREREKERERERNGRTRRRTLESAARKGLKEEERGGGVGLASTVCIEPRPVSSKPTQTPTAAPITLVLAPFPPRTYVR